MYYNMLHLKHIQTNDPLPTSQYELYDGDTHIGMLQIRHKPGRREAVPSHMATNIYYEIDKEYRRKGYGTKLLELGLVEAKRIGLHELFVWCMEDNVASKKIIERNGGVFVAEASILGEGKMLKYRFNL
jgi:predicted acetyltransferase